jgi:hypothetical protein
MAIEKLSVRLKKEYPGWGAPKIRERLRRRYAKVRCPAISTAHAVLDRHGLVTRKGKRRHKAQGTALSRPAQSNAPGGVPRQLAASVPRRVSKLILHCGVSVARLNESDGQSGRLDLQAEASGNGANAIVETQEFQTRDRRSSSQH